MKTIILAVLTLVSTSALAAEYTGTVTVYPIGLQPTVKVIRIEGDAAKALYRSYVVDDVINLGNDEKQKVGTNITCMKDSSDQYKSPKYSCEIKMEDGIALPGGAG